MQIPFFMRPLLRMQYVPGTIYSCDRSASVTVTLYGLTPALSNWDVSSCLFSKEGERETHPSLPPTPRCLLAPLTLDLLHCSREGARAPWHCINGAPTLAHTEHALAHAHARMHSTHAYAHKRCVTTWLLPRQSGPPLRLARPATAADGAQDVLCNAALLKRSATLRCYSGSQWASTAAARGGAAPRCQTRSCAGRSRAVSSWLDPSSWRIMLLRWAKRGGG